MNIKFKTSNTFSDRGRILHSSNFWYFDIGLEDTKIIESNSFYTQ